ncbi:MAG: hypothetical protein ACJ8F7_21220 [Gemmataceae bacterium]
MAARRSLRSSPTVTWDDDTGALQFYNLISPKGQPLVWFMAATDDHGATVSTEHQILEK